MAKDAKLDKVKKPKAKKWRAIFVADDLDKLGLTVTAKSGEVEAVIRSRLKMAKRAIKSRECGKADLVKKLEAQGYKLERNDKGKVKTSSLLKALAEQLQK